MEAELPPDRQKKAREYSHTRRSRLPFVARPFEVDELLEIVETWE